MTTRVRVTIEVDTSMSKTSFKAVLNTHIRSIDPFGGDNIKYLAIEYGIPETSFPPQVIFGRGTP